MNSSTAHSDVSGPSFAELLQSWQEAIQSEKALSYVAEVDQRYHLMAGGAVAQDLVDYRLMRSLWAKRSLSTVLGESARSRISTYQDYRATLALVSELRTLIEDKQVETLLTLQAGLGDQDSAKTLALILADFGNAKYLRDRIAELDPGGQAILRMGPHCVSGFRPIRRSRFLNPAEWLGDPRMGAYEFVDGDPDRIRVRGIELRSGDIGIVELASPGDGILDSFLTEPGVAPHAMLYVSRRIEGSDGRILIQPSMVEIYENGWRSVPVSTALGRDFTWYSEWVRPPGLPNDIGSRLSMALDGLGAVAFDFLGRRIPTGGEFPPDWGQPSATCTNLVRIPFERAGIHDLPYSTTKTSPGAKCNLASLALGQIESVHVPTNLLNEPVFTKVGIVDNGMPEIAYAQALVNGRPEIDDTIGGNFSQKSLVVENLRSWKGLTRWRTARDAFMIKLGQDRNYAGRIARGIFGYDVDAIPTTAPPMTVAFYLCCGFVSGDITGELVGTGFFSETMRGRALPRLSELHYDSQIRQFVADKLDRSILTREGWYKT